MLEAGLVVTAGLALASVIGILVLAAWCRSEVTRRGEEQDKRRAAEEARSKVERERDDALAELGKVTAEKSRALAEVFTYAEAAKRAREELTKHVRERLDLGSDADVAAMVDELLGAPLPAVRGEAPPAGGGDGGAGAPAVRDPG